MKHRPIVGVMGGGTVPQRVYDMAFELGERIAEQGWILLNGGRDAGVMRASSEGAASKGGLTIGILPDGDKSGANPFVQLPIVTNMADARNLINVLSSDVVFACEGGPGTLSEVALALKNNKPVIQVGFDFIRAIPKKGQIWTVDSPTEAIHIAQTLLNPTD